MGQVAFAHRGRDDFRRDHRVRASSLTCRGSQTLVKRAGLLVGSGLRIVLEEGDPHSVDLQGGIGISLPGERLHPTPPLRLTPGIETYRPPIVLDRRVIVSTRQSGVSQ